VGRDLKRVPLDFNWPLDKIWDGYLNPFWKHHVACCKQGYTKEGQFLHDSFYSMNMNDLWAVWAGRNIIAVPPHERLKRMGWDNRICDNIDMARRFGFKSLTNWSDKLEQDDVQALVDDERLWDFTSTFVQGEGWKPKDPPCIPTADEVNAWSGLTMGHDGCNLGTLIKHRCKKYGAEAICQECKGASYIWPSPEVEKQHDKWKEIEPPQGDGFQLWTTTNQGAPITPVFKTLDELCAHCEEHCTTFGRATASAAKWKEMLEKNLVVHREGNAVFL
jgi:hypothetical protein